MTRPVLYVTAPFKTATADDILERDSAIRRAVELGWAPIFAPYLYAPVYTEETEAVRAVMLDCDVALLAAADALLVVGSRTTEGMRVEIAWWGRFQQSLPKFEWPDLPPASEA